MRLVLSSLSLNFCRTKLKKGCSVKPPFLLTERTLTSSFLETKFVDPQTRTISKGSTWVYSVLKVLLWNHHTYDATVDYAFYTDDFMIDITEKGIYSDSFYISTCNIASIYNNYSMDLQKIPLWNIFLYKCNKNKLTPINPKNYFAIRSSC